MKETNHDLEAMPLTEHLRELRTRIIKSIIAVLVGAGFSFYFSNTIFEFLKRPVSKSYPQVELITLSPTEPLFILIKITFIVGLIIASPVVLYQIWRFVEPALYPHEKKLFIPLLISSIVLFISGASFAYFAVLPVALKFLIGIGFSQLNATPFLSVGMYVGFVLKMILGFGLAFEMPIFLFMLQRAGIVREEQLKKFRRYFIVVAFIIGALIAPDVATQILMAVPLLILYEISILLGKFYVKRDENKDG